MSVLLSIKPKYAHAIMSGKKKYEFRKRIPKNFSKIYLYSSSNVQKIIGYLEIGKIIEATPQKLWRMYGKLGGIEREDFFTYFEGYNEGYSMEIKKAKKFKCPIDPYLSYKKFTPPMSYFYISEEKIAKMKKG